jgi:hypothetical protein
MCSLPAQAQWWGHYPKWEISPFVGYETSGSFPINTSLIIDRVRVDSSASFGAFLDYSLTENTQAEFLWNRNNTSFSQHNFITNTYSKAFNSDVDQYSFGMLYMLRSVEKPLRPYIAGGLGFTHEFNDGLNTNHTSFSYSVGGGVKYSLARHFALRGDIRYMPTRANSTPQQFCSIYYGCYIANVRNYIHRGNFTGGIVFKF